MILVSCTAGSLHRLTQVHSSDYCLISSCAIPAPESHCSSQLRLSVEVKAEGEALRPGTVAQATAQSKLLLALPQNLRGNHQPFHLLGLGVMWSSAQGMSASKVM